MEHFVAGATARTAGALVGVNHKTAAYYFHRLHEIVYQATEDEMPFFGEIEVDESYFGGKRKGKRGRGASGKVPVFGLLKRGGKVYAKVIPNAKGNTYIEGYHGQQDRSRQHCLSGHVQRLQCSGRIGF